MAALNEATNVVIEGPFAAATREIVPDRYSHWP